jgi:hypothetical protein
VPSRLSFTFFVWPLIFFFAEERSQILPIGSDEVLDDFVWNLVNELSDIRSELLVCCYIADSLRKSAFKDGFQSPPHPLNAVKLTRVRRHEKHLEVLV